MINNTIKIIVENEIDKSELIEIVLTINYIQILLNICILYNKTVIQQQI